MPFSIVCEDITRMRTDAVVNAANNELQKGGGVCRAIFNAAGAERMRAACAPLAPIRTGAAVLTPGFDLPAKYVIHTAGPVYGDGKQGEEALLRQCYQNAFQQAVEKGCESIAFPLISSGIYGYPKSEALRVAKEEIRRFLSRENCDMHVVLALCDKESFEAPGNLLSEVRRYARWCCTEGEAQPAGTGFAAASAARGDTPFSEVFLRFAEEKGKTDAELCIRANIDRKQLAQIRGDKAHQPGKQTVVALAVALELSLEESRSLLQNAGCAFSQCEVFDVIIKYCLAHKRYDIFEINDVLFHYDQPLLGG